jgi:ATP-dependent Clp endopeptidase proteolytic subunit ClpP
MRRQFPRADRPFYEVKAATRAEGEPTETEIWIYDVIGDDWFDESLTAKVLCQTIAQVDTDEIVLHFNSPGGSLSDGIAIYNALITHPAKVRSVIEGWTGSIATVIALAADPGCVAMFDNTMWMVHHPWGVKVGNAAEMRGYADYLDRCSALMQRVYLDRITKSEEELVAALDAETYFDAAQAAEWGFVDEVLCGQQAAAACDTGVLQALGFNPDPHNRGREPLAVGRTISAENEGKLRDAVSLLDEVLSTLDARASDPAPAGSGDAPRTMGSKQVAAMKLASPRH